MTKYQILNRIEELIKLATSQREEINNLYGQNNDEWKNIYASNNRRIEELVKYKYQYQSNEYNDDYFIRNTRVEETLNTIESQLKSLVHSINKHGFFYGDKYNKYRHELERLYRGDGTPKSRIVKGFHDILLKYEALEPQVKRLSSISGAYDRLLFYKRHDETFMREAAACSYNVEKYEEQLKVATNAYNSFSEWLAKEYNIRP